MGKLRLATANTQPSFMMEESQQSSSRVKSSRTMSAAKKETMTHVLSLMSSTKRRINALRFSVIKHENQRMVRMIVALWDGVTKTIF